MSGECDDCSEHTLECSCHKRPSKGFPIKPERFAIIGGDIHTLISRTQLDKLQKQSFVPWFVEENKNFVWIPVQDEKARCEGKWVWIEFGEHACSMCKRKFFYKTMEG